MVRSEVSFWQVFRIIFTIFFLYLVGDAFYRWDGFRFYASFFEFIPSFALVTIFWTVSAVFFSSLIWLLLVVAEQISFRLRWRFTATHIFLFVSVFILLGIFVWGCRRFIWPTKAVTINMKLTAFFILNMVSVFITWFLRNKAESWMKILQGRITPLVWLFGIWFVLSFPLVVYHAWGKEGDKVISQQPKKISDIDRKKPNIIFVTFDTLTAREMSLYGYKRPTTPFINKWSTEATVFTRLEAESNITTPTTASLMTGKRVWTHQSYQTENASSPVRSNIENLPLVLKENGYYNLAFIQNPLASVKTLGMTNSFEIAPHQDEFWTYTSFFGLNPEIIDVKLYRLFGDKIKLYNWIVKEDFILYKFISTVSRDVTETLIAPEKAFERFLKTLDDNLPKPFFVWIHLLPPHYNYLPPKQYMGMFDSSKKFRTMKSQSVWESKHDFVDKDKAEIDILRSRYDEYIRYCDSQFEDFIKQLTNKSKLQNTVIIVSSDHGESFEHNYFKHDGPYLYEQLTHVPLIIKMHNQKEGLIINDLVEQIDIPATILDLAGIPVPSWMEGRSLAPLLRGDKLPLKPAFSMALQKNPSRGHKITKGTIAVWEGDYKLIHYFDKNESLLFNLKKDPDEMNNFFDKEPVLAHRLLSLIKEGLSNANEKISMGQ